MPLGRQHDGAAERLDALLAEVRACRLCEPQLPHDARPVVQAGKSARLLVVGQAPGSRAHAGGRGWDDDSGERLRSWLGLDDATFYDPAQVALVSLGLCYPGKGASGDLPPRRECAPLWHARLFAAMPEVRLKLLVGHHAQRAYLPPALRPSMTYAVRAIDAMPDGTVALPHPAWRARLWMQRHPWFEEEILPRVRAMVAAALS